MNDETQTMITGNTEYLSFEAGGQSYAIDDAAKRIRTGLRMDSGTVRYAVPRPRHSAKAAARCSLKFDLV